jgi:hypothetical protein
MTQETETVSLLPCPFCGSQPECFPSGDGTGTMIECISPDCVHPHVSYYGDGEAARRWNTRVSTNKDETIAKLEAENAKLRLVVRAQFASRRMVDSEAWKYAESIARPIALTSTKKEG